MEYKTWEGLNNDNEGVWEEDGGVSQEQEKLWM